MPFFVLDVLFFVFESFFWFVSFSLVTKTFGFPKHSLHEKVLNDHVRWSLLQSFVLFARFYNANRNKNESLDLFFEAKKKRNQRTNLRIQMLKVCWNNWDKLKACRTKKKFFNFYFWFRFFSPFFFTWRETNRCFF